MQWWIMRTDRRQRWLAICAGSLGLAGILATSSAAQPLRGGVVAAPYVGVLRGGGARAPGENRWGAVGGLLLEVPVAPRVRLLGDVAYLRTPDALRVANGGDGYLYDDVGVAATLGAAYDVLARRATRISLGAEIGPGWSRNVESGQFGTPRPSLALATDDFSVNVVGKVRAGVRRALSARSAVGLDLGSYLAPDRGWGTPWLAVSLAIQLGP